MNYKNEGIISPEVIRKVSLVVPREEMDAVFNDITTFFQKQIFTKPISYKVVPITYQEDTKYNLEANTDQENIENLKNNPQDFLNFLMENPTLCRSLIINNLNILVKFYTMKNFFNYANLSFISNCFELYNFTFFNSTEKKAGLFEKDVLKPARENLLLRMKQRKLFFENQFLIKTYKHGFYNPAIRTPTAFAASENTFYVGFSNCDIMFIPTSAVVAPSVLIISALKKTKPEFSLCYANNTLYAITENEMFIIDPDTKKYTQITGKNIPKPSVVSDGRYLYSISKSLVVSMYVIENKKPVLIKTIKLNSSEKVKFNSLMVATDGTFISFMQITEDSNVFYQFSLVTGKLMNKDVVEKPANDVFAWCVIPSARIITYDKDNILIYVSKNEIPRWIVGHRLPELKKESTITDMYDIFLYNGFEIFPEYHEAEIPANLTMKFLSENNISGLYVMIHILSRGPNEEFLEKIYDQIKSPQLRTYVMFSYLTTVRNSPGMRASKNFTIASKYINDGNSMELIILFHELFDFKRIPLDALAVNKLLNEIVSLLGTYPKQCNSIIESFLVNYAEKEIMQGRPENVFIILYNVSRNIQSELNKYVLAICVADFENTVFFETWSRLMRVVYSTRKAWRRCGQTFCKIFDITTEKPIPKTKENRAIINMLNRSYFLHLELIFSVPFRRSIPVQKDKILSEFPHPMDGVDPELDDKVFELISNAYDIDAMKSFSETFNSVRNYISFTSQKEKVMKNLERLLVLKCYCAEDIIDFLENGIEYLLPLSCDEAVIQWLISRCGSFNQKQTIDQFIIFSIFADNFNERIVTILTADNTKLRKFVQWFRYPFLLPADIVRVSLYQITAEMISQTPAELIECSFNDFIVCCKQIDNKQNFFKLVAPVFQQFSTKKGEISALPNGDNSILYKSILKLHLGIASGFIPPHSKYMMAYKSYIHAGNYKTINAVLNAMLCALQKCPDSLEEFIDFLIELIGKYIITKNNPFVWQKTPLENVLSLFSVINFLRVAFNHKNSACRKQIISCAKEFSLVKAVGIFAVMNDSIDFIRCGLTAFFTDKDGVAYEGTISTVDPYSCIFEAESRAFSTKMITKFIPKVDNAPDLSLLDNLSPFAILLEKTNVSDSSVRVFKEASLAFFCKNEKFVQLLSDEFVTKIVREAKYSNFVPGNTYLDFIYYFSRVQEALPRFAFCSKEANSSKNMSRKNTSTTVKGRVMTNVEATTFTSTPLYTKYATHISLKLCPNDRLSKQSSFTVFALCSATGEKFKTEKYDMTLENNVFSIEINPKEQLLLINEEKYAISPAVSMLFISLDVNHNQMLEYSFFCDQHVVIPTKNNDVFEFNNDVSCKLLRVTHVESKLPFADSSLYIEGKLEENANLMCESLKTISACLLAVARDKPVNPENILDAMLAANPFPLEEIITPEKCKLRNLFGNCQSILFNFGIKKTTKENIQCIFCEIAKRLNNHNRLYITPENTTALFINELDKVMLRDSIVINPSSEKPVKYLSFSPNFCIFSCKSLVIPCSDISCSIMEFHVNIRHAMILARKCNFTDISKLAEPLNEFVKTHSHLRNLFAHALDLLESLFPFFPEGCRVPALPPESFFFPESTVFSCNKEIAILGLMENLINPIDMAGNEASFSFFSAEQTIIEVRTSPRLENDNVFHVTQGDNTYELKPNHYMIINSGRIVITCDKDPTNFNVYAYPINENFRRVEEDLLSWSVEDSCLLCATFQENCEIDQSVYQYLSISHKYDFFTAKVIYTILEQAPTTQLATVRLNRPVSTEHKTNVFDVEIENYLFSRKICEELADYTKVTEKRAKYLEAKELSSIEFSNPFFLMASAFPPQTLMRLADPMTIFHTIPNSKSTVFLKKYLRAAPTIAVIEFVELCTGETSLDNCRIDCAQSIKKGEITAVPEERLFIIGIFDGIEEFSMKLREKIFERNHNYK